MTTIKLQIICFLATAFLFIRYTSLSKQFATSSTSKEFRWLLGVAFVETILDMATAFTVNHLGIPLWINYGLHWLFFISIDTLMYCAYIYFLASLPGGNTHTADRKVVRVLYIINMAVVTATMPLLYYVEGGSTNYSMGIPVYACFVMAYFYVLLLGYKVILNWRKIVSGQQKVNLVTIVFLIAAVSILQFNIPELLITSIVAALVSVSAYINQEDPLRQQSLANMQSLMDEVAELNEKLRIQREKYTDVDNTGVWLEFVGSRQETFRVKYEDFYLAESEGNYVSIQYYKGGEIHKKVLRQTMKAILETVEKYPKIKRVHRAYIVNLDHQITVEGSSSQGFQLIFEGIREPIPVSRNLVAELQELISEG